MCAYDVNTYIHMDVHSRKGVIFILGNIIQTVRTPSPTGQPYIHYFVHTYAHSTDDVHMCVRTCIQ